MNTRRVQRDIPTTPRTPQNTNIAGGRGRGQNLALGRRTFIDDLVARTNSSTGACHQGSSVRRSPITPRVEASVSHGGFTNKEILYHVHSYWGFEYS